MLSKKKLFIIAGIILVLFNTSTVFSDESIKSSITELVIKLQPSVIDNMKPSVAILDFSTSVNAAKFEKYLNSIIFEEFFTLGKVKLIERENIDNILKEQQFQISGNVNDESAKSIGKIIGVDYVCYGTVIEFDNSIRISGKTVDIQTGEVVSIGSVNLEKNKDIEILLNPSYKGNKTFPSNNEKKETNWKITVNRNDFDAITAITLLCIGSGTEKLVLVYEKNDDALRSRVRTGLYTKIAAYNSYSSNNYDFKLDDGTIITDKWIGYSWSSKTGRKGNTELIEYWAPKLNHRKFLDIFLDNNLLVIRDGDKVFKFNMSGLSKLLTENNISYKELSGALSNEEF